jgi:predicted Zn-dependent protease
LERHDFQGLESALQELLRFDPPPATAVALHAAWVRKCSTTETAELAPLLMDYHLRRNDLTTAAQEAEQVLRRFPRHWLAHCVRLHAALNEHPAWDSSKPPQKIMHLREQFPDPEDEAALTTPAGLLYALRLWHWLQQDTNTLRRVLERRVLPILRTAKAQEASPLQQLHLIACWLAVAELPDSITTTSQYWAAVDQLSELAVQQAIAQADLEALRYWLVLAPALEQQLQQWQREAPLRFPDNRIAPFQQELRRRRRMAMNAWRSLEPHQPEVYFHLAELAWQEKDIRGAFDHYLEALRRCPDPVPIWERFLPFLTHFASESSLQQLAQHLWKQAEQAGKEPQLWCLAAQAATALQRYEQAIEACKHARQIQAGYPTACLLEATLWLRSGDSSRAQAALESLDSQWFRRHPEAARLYARCLAVTVSGEALIQRYHQLFPNTLASSPSAAAFLRGAGENTQAVEVLRWAVRELQAGVVRGDPLWCRYYTELRFRLAEALVRPHPTGGPAVWDGEAVTAALYAFQTLPPDQLREPEMLLAQAILYAFGRRQPEVARRLIEPLLSPASSRPLTPAQQLALAYILLANEQPQDALPILTVLQQSSSPPAALWIALAWAYHDLREPQQAAAALHQATLTPYRSAREQADWAAIKHRILSGKPP